MNVDGSCLVFITAVDGVATVAGSVVTIFVDDALPDDTNIMTAGGVDGGSGGEDDTGGGSGTFGGDGSGGDGTTNLLRSGAVGGGVNDSGEVPCGCAVTDGSSKISFRTSSHDVDSSVESKKLVDGCLR